MSKKVVVCAYHNVGYRCLEELLKQGADVRLVFTHEDSPTEEIWFQSVRELAERHGIPYLTTDINEPANVAKVREIAPDLLFSFYYRNMIKPEVLEIPRLGALNLHGSYLPKYRGRVPVNWAVINGETETGATLHHMVAKPDAGDIVDREKVTIAFTDTSFDVFTKVTEAAVTIIARAYPLLAAGTAPRIPMNLAEGSYFGGRKPADGLIDWTKSAVRIYNLIRGVTHPYPGAFTYLEGKKVIIWSTRPLPGSAEPGMVVTENPLVVGTGEGLLEITSLQPEGEDEVAAGGFAAIVHPAGKRFANP
ncbi:formyltransferase [Geobacter hydrogenophilus]|uniref:Formyltransferase n=1 Tax=Geobacter hydrogenophilus TaxID=40983 RepID=A0A9W6LC70_9BACT|nr:formyltransferase [Geobacter hydrogenophilus]MBT0894646.1 formyltransferase [Geobacter hydrogenophilus]GLI37156.1 formyltransferase [Geobacter hydrogenophilus]